jgi:pyruvate carboxylase subunit B
VRNVADYAFGLYGKPPAPIDTEFQKMLFKKARRKGDPITCRPADLLEPEMDKAREAVKDITQDNGDVLIYALNATTGMQFLRKKYGLEAPSEKP